MKNELQKIFSGVYKTYNFCDVVNDCKKLVRDSGHSIIVSVENRWNNYYSTQIFPVKKGDKELFSLCVEKDEVSASYKLSYDNNDYIPKNWYQTMKAESLRRFLNRKAKKYKNKLAEQSVAYLQR